MAYTVGNLELNIYSKNTGAIKSLDAVINRLTKLQACVKTLDVSKITKLSNDFSDLNKNLNKSASNQTKNINSAFNIGKLWIVYRVARRIGGAFANIVQSGTDYTETLNLWSVAMRDNLDLADKFVNKMNKAYGISEDTLMNAQAIFKNMIGSLGQIDDNTAYQLSEAITQMAVDYSSLYNVQLKSAFSKFQAMLAGQVRPIRSVSGYDITETTLYQLYQQLGGEKTMRQLTRTEKQLLSIYAVFKQMGASGALGDMTKTLDQFANQSRMMTENFKRTGMWAGVILKHLLQESGVMIHINAILITISEVLKAIALRIKATGDENFGEPIFKGAEEASNAVDKLNGKLLDFDKFRSLENGGNGGLSLGIDKALLDAIKGYSGVIDKTKNSAHELAMEWLSILGFTVGDDGVLTIADNKIDNIIQKIKDFFLFVESVLITFISYNIGKGIANMILSLGTAQSVINPLIISMQLLVYGVLQFMNAWKDMSGLERFINILSAITAGILGVVIAIKALHLGVLPAIGIGSALAGAIMAITASITPRKIDVDKKADGGMVDKGTMFIAGEAGAEIVYNSSNGQSGVANIAQLKSAFYQALVEYGESNTNANLPVDVYIDGELVYQTVTNHAKRRGESWSR